MFKCMGNSDVVLDGFLSFNAGVGAAKIGPNNIKLIILHTSELNKCAYCAAVHTKLATDAGLLTDEECLKARKGTGPDEKSTQMLTFARKAKLTNGSVSEADLKAIRDAGFDDQEIIEILGTIVMISFANFVSNAAQPDQDFPPVPAL